MSLPRGVEGDIVGCMQHADCWSWAKGGSAIFLILLAPALIIRLLNPADWPALFAPTVLVGVGLPFLLFGWFLTAMCLYGRRKRA